MPNSQVRAQAQPPPSSRLLRSSAPNFLPPPYIHPTIRLRLPLTHHGTEDQRCLTRCGTAHFKIPGEPDRGEFRDYCVGASSTRERKSSQSETGCAEGNDASYVVISCLIRSRCVLYALRNFAHMYMRWRTIRPIERSDGNACKKCS